MKAIHVVGAILLCTSICAAGATVVLKDVPVFVEGRYLVGTVTSIAISLMIGTIGFFFGLLYGRQTGAGSLDERSLARFRQALSFEREQRQRIERLLYEKKPVTRSVERHVGNNKAVVDGQQEPPVGERPEKEEADAEIERLKQQLQRVEKELSLRKGQIADLHVELSVSHAEAEKTKTEIERLKTSSKSQGER